MHDDDAQHDAVLFATARRLVLALGVLTVLWVAALAAKVLLQG